MPRMYEYDKKDTKCLMEKHFQSTDASKDDYSTRYEFVQVTQFIKERAIRIEFISTWNSAYNIIRDFNY